MSAIEQKYIEKCNTVSDINEHLPTLYEYAKKCETVAEFGVRDVCSSYALAYAKPKKLICVDIETNIYTNNFVQMCENEGVNIKFDQADTLNYELESVDLLFIDTLHTYSQLSEELKIHHSKVKRYLIFHDTISYGTTNEHNTPDKKQGLVPAIKEFLQEHPEWKEVCTYTNNNGLTILERQRDED